MTFETAGIRNHRYQKTFTIRVLLRLKQCLFTVQPKADQLTQPTLQPIYQFTARLGKEAVVSGLVALRSERPPHPPHPRSTNPVRCWQLPPEGLLGRRERFSKQGANHFSRCDTSCFVEVTWHKPCASSRTAMDTTNIRKQLWNNRRPQDPDKQLPSGRPVSFLAALSGPTFPWIPCL